MRNHINDTMMIRKILLVAVKVVVVILLLFFIITQPPFRLGPQIFKNKFIGKVAFWCVSPVLRMLERTTYAPGYTEEAFKKITIGMSQDTVLELLGEPLNKTRWENGSETWRYSKSAGDTDYRLRSVLIKDDKVIKKFSSLYIT